MKPALPGYRASNVGVAEEEQLRDSYKRVAVGLEARLLMARSLKEMRGERCFNSKAGLARPCMLTSLWK